MVQALEWKVESPHERAKHHLRRGIACHPALQKRYSCELGEGKTVFYDLWDNGLGDRITAYARSIPDQDPLQLKTRDQSQLITYMAYGRLAPGMIHDNQPPFSHRQPQEKDDRAELLSFIAEEMEGLLSVYESASESHSVEPKPGIAAKLKVYASLVDPREIATLKEIVRRSEHFHAGRFTDEDRRLFWGYDNRWEWNQVPLTFLEENLR